jgi:hypothetical protein
MAGGATHPGADLLDQHNERIDQGHEPAEPEANPPPGLAVSGDRSGVVVRGATDEAGAEDLEQSWFARPDDRTARPISRDLLLPFRHSHSVWPLSAKYKPGDQTAYEKVPTPAERAQWPAGQPVNYYTGTRGRSRAESCETTADPYERSS